MQRHAEERSFRDARNKPFGFTQGHEPRRMAWLFLASYEAAADLELTRFFSVIPVALATLSKAEGERARDKIFVSRRKLSDLERESL